MLSRRHFLKLAGLGAAGLGLGLKPAALPLRLVATGRSVSPALLAAFTDSTGSLVHLDFLEDRGSIARHDLAVVPSHQLTGLIRESRVRPLGRLSLPLAFEQRAYDPLNAFSLPAARGAIGINVRRTAPPASWAEFFDLARLEPTYLPQADSFGAALKSMGHSINTRSALARSRARTLLAGMKSVPLPEARLAVGAPIPGWDFAIPAGGGEGWEDCFCIPADSSSPDLAHAFIRFALAHQPPAPFPDIPLEPRSPFAPPPV